MNSSLLSLLVLAGIAIFLILRLRSVLGTREGFEKPPAAQAPTRAKTKRTLMSSKAGLIATLPTMSKMEVMQPKHSPR